MGAFNNGHNFSGIHRNGLDFNAVYHNGVKVWPDVATNTLKNGLVWCYELDEESGTTIIDSCGLYPAINNGFSLNNQGKINKAVSTINSSSSYINTNMHANYNEFTVNCWCYPTALDSIHGLVVYGSGTANSYDSVSWHLSYAPSHGFYLIICQWPIVTYYLVRTLGLITININEWYMVTAVRDVNGSEIYINGQLIARANFSYTVRTITNHLTKIGSNVAYRNWNGKIDQTALWQLPLSASDITALYNSGNGLSYENWK